MSNNIEKRKYKDLKILFYQDSNLFYIMRRTLFFPQKNMQFVDPTLFY